MLQFDPVFQTKDNRGTKELRQRLGPICSSHNTWLGKGYYFWDGHIELAQWWGERHYHGNYVICQACIELEKEMLFDLYGNTSDQKVFNIVLQALHKKYPNQQLTVPAVLDDMNAHSEEFRKMKAIRASSEHCIPQAERVKYIDGQYGTHLTIPAIQICAKDLNVIKGYDELPLDNTNHVV